MLSLFAALGLFLAVEDPAPNKDATKDSTDVVFTFGISGFG